MLWTELSIIWSLQVDNKLVSLASSNEWLQTVKTYSHVTSLKKTLKIKKLSL